MKSVRLDYSGHLVIEDVPVPQLSSDSQVKIRVRYAAINADDYAMYTGRLGTRYVNAGLMHEFSGEIVETGSAAASMGLKVGDKVSGRPLISCGICHYCRTGKPNLCIEARQTGVLDEYILRDLSAVVRLPKGLSLQAGALSWLATNTLTAVERLGISAGHRVLIHGGGATGLLFLSVIKDRYPSLLVVSEPIEAKRHLALKLGADVVFNPDERKIHEQTLAYTNGLGFDYIIDAAGNAEIFKYTLDCLARGGSILLFSNYPLQEKISFTLSDIYWKEATILSAYGSRHSSFTDMNADYLVHLNLERFISRVMPAEQITEALELYGTRQELRILIEL